MGNYFLHCTIRETVVSQHSDDTDENSDSPSTKTKMCNRKLTWRRPGTVPIYCCRTMAPDTYLRCLYWFCDDCSYNTALHESRLVPPQRCGASLFIACARFCNWQCVACKTHKASLVALAISSPLTRRG